MQLVSLDQSFQLDYNGSSKGPLLIEGPWVAVSCAVRCILDGPRPVILVYMQKQLSVVTRFLKYDH
jgi:hypothetical protein